MTYWIENYILTLTVAVLLAGLMIPKILLIAFRRKLFDTVDERKIHTGIVPRLGGISFLPALAFSFCVVVGYNLRFNSGGLVPELKMVALPIFFLVCALMLIYLIGLADDLIGVRYRAKFVVQIVAGVLITGSGMWVDNLHGLFWIGELPWWIGCAMTIVGIIYVVNAVNLIDGIDGLASGLSAVALIWYSYVFYVTGEYMYMLLTGATLGTLIPFFYYNVFGKASNHTKIFMGDTGSLTVGMMLAFLTIAVFKLPDASMPSHDNICVVAFAPLMLPCFDVARVFLHRVRKGRNPFLPDKSHIHHKLLAMGLPQWKALVLIVAADMVLVLVNVALSGIIAPTWICVGDVALWIILNLMLTSAIRRREKRLGVVLYE